MIKLTDKKNVRQSHVMPDFYLRKFASDGELFAYSREKPIRRISVDEGKPVKECRERDYFEYEVYGQITNNRVENWLALIEGRAGVVYSKVLNCQPLTAEERITWAVFVASLFLRTRKVRHQLAPMTLQRVQNMMIGEDAVRGMQHELLMDGRLITFERLRAQMMKVWTEMQAPAFGHLIAIENSTSSLAQNLLAKDWYVVGTPEGSSLITSDAPVVTMKLAGKGAAFLGYGFGQHDVAAILPMSPNKAFIASPTHISWNDLDHNSLMLINRSIAAFADRHIYADIQSDETQALANTELGQIRYGENAFRAS